MTEDISNERIKDILDKYTKDWANLMTFSDAIEHLLIGSLAEMTQEDRQRLVEAYNRYRAAPYDWYYSVE